MNHFPALLRRTLLLGAAGLSLSLGASSQSAGTRYEEHDSGRFDVSVGGSWSTAWGRQITAAPVGPGVYAITLNRLGTGWSERFLIGIPQNSSGFAPALVLFHGYGETPDDLLANTDYFAKAQARGWFVIAPLGAHKFNYSIPYAQRNVERALGWCAKKLPIDLDRMYAVGFSMGGGMATSYAARHQNPRRGRFAAVVDHTGTVSIQDCYWMTGDKLLMESPLMFGDTPLGDPFAYQRASTIDLAPGSTTVDQDTDMLRNMTHISVKSFAASFDPLTFLVNQTQLFSDQMTVRGGSANLYLANASIHNWSTLDETATLNWLDGISLAERGPNQLHSLLADRKGRWYDFNLVQHQTDAFTPLTWYASPAANKLYLVDAGNLKRVVVHTSDLGLSSSQPLEVVFGSNDGQPTDIAFTGFATVPSQVKRNGTSSSSWSWNATTRVLVLHETSGGGTPSWTLQP
ncbi:MAG: pimeloyl-ACP methyl ester carboxylesterase [Planctomycetota bacterium]|jgi:pimeloyl-ACP methyl ester carboxylesterase